MALLEKLRRQTPSDVESFNIESVDLEIADQETKIKVANQLFKMISWIVWEGRFATSQDPDSGTKITEKNIGHGIKAQFREIYADTCRLDENILIHRHERTGRGAGGFEFWENIAWINLGQLTIFSALWGWGSVDGKSLLILTTPKAREAYCAIQKIYLELLEEKTAKDQQN